MIKNRIQTKTRSGERLGRSRDAWAQPSLCLRQGLAVPAPNGFQGLCRPLTLVSPMYFWLFGKCPMWTFHGSKCLLEHVFSARRRGPPTAPSNVLNVMSKTGLQDGGTEILLLRMAFTLKKLTRHHSPFNVRIYENASPLLNLRQGWFSHFEITYDYLLNRKSICKIQEKNVSCPDTTTRNFRQVQV